MCPTSCETCRRVCTQTSARTNKPNLAKNNRKGNRCFQLKCQRLPRSRVLTWCGCAGPRATGRDHIWKSVRFIPRPRCHVRHRPDLQRAGWLFLGCGTRMQEKSGSCETEPLFAPRPTGSTGPRRSLREQYHPVGVLTSVLFLCASMSS